MVNTIVIQGRLTKEVVNRNGNAYFSIAQNDFKGNPMYVEIVAFGKSAEYSFNYLHKGDMVLVEGNLAINKYQDKYYTNIVAVRITSVGNSNKDTNIVKEDIKQEESIATDDIDINADDYPF